MTREEAKKWFENALDNNDFFPETKDAFKVAIEALSTDKPQDEDWERYSEKLWQLAYERGKNDQLKDMKGE